MNKIVSILMRRDCLTESEATRYFNEIRDEIQEAAESGDYDLVEDIMIGDLGLEMDYIFDILY